MSPSWTAASHGIDWHLELDRDRLLPGRLATGTITLAAEHDVSGRSIIVALVATEHWQHDETTTDAQGHVSTRTVTTRREHQRLPVEVSGPFSLPAGEVLRRPVELPVPPLGPATLEATVLGMTWTIEAKVDDPGWIDSRMEVGVRVVQPVALLRAGVVHVGEFALYPAADSGEAGLSANVSLDPLPLGAGAPFRGEVHLHAASPHRLQEIRAEIRVAVRATVSSGKSQTITAWNGTLSGPTEISGDSAFAFASELADVALPTIELPHGTASASFHVILATAWARDPHLVRDISIATTLEL
jgi:hypothetical protein